MRRVSPVYRSLDGWGQRDDCHGISTGECRDENGIKTCRSVRLRSSSSATVRRVSPVYKSLDGWRQRDNCHDNNTGECRAKKLEGERAVQQRLTQLQCAMEITVDLEQADRRKLLDKEAQAITNWLQQAFTEFGTRLRQQMQRKSLEENTEEDERQSLNRAEQAILETQHKQLEEETTKLKDQQAELVTTARRMVEKSSGLLEIFEKRLQEVN